MEIGIMECGVVLQGRVHYKWPTEKQSMLKAFILRIKHKETNHLASSFCCTSQSGKSSRVFKALSSSENQLRSLDSYFRKLHNDGMQSSSSSFNKSAVSLDTSDQVEAKKGLRSLEYYLDKTDEDGKSKMYSASSSEVETVKAASSSSIKSKYKRGKVKKSGSYMRLKEKEGNDGLKSDDEPSNFLLIGIMASINIAVFLFEIASPIRNSDLKIFSLPMAYGAKINHLIVIGEWWRLVTPMFLHSGAFHIALSCWMLLTFGPPVCCAYGSFTFFLIYVLGGISGNMISFLHTPEPTVGGTGPVFAIIGAWLIYQIQNRDLLGKDASESLFNKAIIATSLSCTLSNFGPVDDWTHLGAAFTGLAYGFFTCPTAQVDDKTSESGQEEGIRLVTLYGDPCKSLVCFSLFILLWGSLLFVIDPPLNFLAGDHFE